MKIRGLSGDNKGFTLLEIVIVIIIIGVLAGLALPQYVGYVERTRAAEAMNAIGAIKVAETDYKLRTGSYKYCANNVDVNTHLGVMLSTRYWNYVANYSGDDLTITATRTSEGGGGGSGNTIVYTYSAPTASGTAGTMSWSGNHSGVPK